MTNPAKIEAVALKPCPFCGVDIDVPGSAFTGGIKSANHPTNNCILSGQSWWFVPRFIKPWNTRVIPLHEEHET